MFSKNLDLEPSPAFDLAWPSGIQALQQRPHPALQTQVQSQEPPIQLKHPLDLLQVREQPQPSNQVKTGIFERSLTF